MKLKRILSFVLAAALVLAVAPAVSLDVDAATETTFYAAGNKEYSMLYCGYNGTSSVGGAGYTTQNQTLAEIEASGYVNLEKNPCVTWNVYAEDAGDYTFAVKFSGGGSLDTDGKYNMVVSVNDRDYYVGKDYTTANFNSGADGEQFILTLDQGVNVIRILSVASVENKKCSWVDIGGLFVDNNLTVLKASSLTLDVDDTAHYVNRWQRNCDGSADLLGNVDNSQAGSLDYYNINKSNLTKTAYFSYTLNVPYDGYYNITFRASIENAEREAYYIVRVDGMNYVRGVHTYKSMDLQNISVYLPAGTHTFTVISPKAYNSGTRYWCNVKEITFSGGITLADTSIDPSTVNDAHRLEAEDGILWRYDNRAGTGALSGNRVGGIGNEGGKLISQSLADMSTNRGTAEQPYYWVQKNNLPSVSYVVNVSKAGTYTLKSVYCLSSASGQKVTDYFMTVVVNDDSFYKAEFMPAVNKATGWSASDVRVELKEGVNVIRMISEVAETNAYVAWLDQDYVDIAGPGTVELIDHDAVAGDDGKGNDSVTHLQSGESSYTKYFDTIKTSSSADGWFNSYLADYKGGNAHSRNICAATLKSSNLGLMHWLGYFSYTVDVPADGYYDLQTYITTADDKDYTGNFIFIDLTEDSYKVYDFGFTENDGSRWLNRAAQNTSVYLTKGTHTLVVSGIRNINTSSGYTDWADTGALTVSGGITKSAVQIDPLSYSYPSVGLVSGSVYAVDSNNVVSGVPFGATVVELKSNFIHSENITVTGDKDGVVIPGTTLTYADGTVYTVELMAKGDLNGDNKIDIRDLKLANEHVIGSSALPAALQSVADIDNDGTVMSSDINSYRAIVHGESFTDVVYQPSSIGADAILELCNPVGRLTKTKDAVYMEHSASNLTITGRLSGDVVLNLYVDKVESDPIGLFIEIDGEMSYVRLSEAYKDVSITIAEDLDPNNHVIKISKSTDAKNDGIYINSISYNGTLTKSEPAEHKIVFLGDSITAGCGVYKSSEENFSKYGITASYFSYANVASDILGADYYSVANGGWSLCNDGWRIYDIYDTFSMHSWTKLGDYDFSFKPEVVVINLGTNDRGNTDEADVKAEAKNIIDLVKANNANATIFWAYEMMQDDAANIAWIKAVCEENGVHYVALPENVDGWGSHPTVEGQKAAGEKLAEFIAQKMGW